MIEWTVVIPHTIYRYHMRFRFSQKNFSVKLWLTQHITIIWNEPFRWKKRESVNQMEIILLEKKYCNSSFNPLREKQWVFGKDKKVPTDIQIRNQNKIMKSRKRIEKLHKTVVYQNEQSLGVFKSKWHTVNVYNLGLSCFEFLKLRQMFGKFEIHMYKILHVVIWNSRLSTYFQIFL